MTSRADFDAWVAEARAADIVDAARVRGARLKRAGAELVGPCPACGGRDRFAVHPVKRIFHCRISRAGGDVIALVQYLDACDFRAACERLTGRPAPTGGRGEVDEDLLRRREEERARAAREAEASENRYRRAERAKAWGIWSRALPIGGAVRRRACPVTDYLHGRGLIIPRSFEVRLAPELSYWAQRERGGTEGGAKEGGVRQEADIVHTGPAMVALIVGHDRTFAGVHITWIDPARPGRKAEIVHPDTGEILPAKKVRGSQRGGHIPLWRAPRIRRLILGEGIETVLSSWTAMGGPEAQLMRGSAGWAGVSLGNIGGPAEGTCRHPTLKRPPDAKGRIMPVRVPSVIPRDDGRAIPVPDSVDEIILLGDGDSDRFTTEITLKRAAARWRRPGRAIRIAWAPEGQDFNDWLRAAMSAPAKEGAAA